MSRLKYSLSLWDFTAAASFAVTVPLVLLNPRRFFPLLLLCVLIIGVKGIKQRRFFEKTPLDFLLLLYLTAVLLSTAFVARPVHSFPRAVNILLFILLFYLIVSLLRSQKAIQVAVQGYLISGVLLSLFGTTGMLLSEYEPFGPLTKLRGWLPFFNFHLPGAERGIEPNALGGLLIYFLPLFAVLVFHNVEKGRRIAGGMNHRFFRGFVFFGLCLLLFALVLTQSRGAWAGGLSGLLVLFVARTKKKKVLFAVLVAVLVILAVLSFHSINRIEKGRIVTGLGNDMMTFRIGLWDLAAGIIDRHPLLGIGLNEIRYHPEMDYRYAHAHNIFINTAAEMGMPAAAVTMGLLIGLAYMVISGWARSPSDLFSRLLLGLGAGQLAHLVFSLTDMIRPGSRAGIVYWTSAALIVVLYKHSMSQGDSTSSEK